MNNKILNTLTLKRLLLTTALIGVVGCGSSDSNTPKIKPEPIALPQSHSETQNDYTSENQAEEKIPATVSTAILSEKSSLTQELKDSITYMYNEEKLAKDIYLNVYKMQPLQQLYNIATKSETKHEDAVNDLAIKYDLNTTLYPDTEIPYDKKSLDAYGSGEYPVVAIQELYDTLYEKGIQSQKDALEVGCLVEVTDIDDLDKYMAQATASNALDVLEVFDFLRKGSYKHYWAFDKALKNKGVAEGCCSLGKKYCHPEYPQSEGGDGGNSGKGNGKGKIDF